MGSLTRKLRAAGIGVTAAEARPVHHVNQRWAKRRERNRATGRAREEAARLARAAESRERGTKASPFRPAERVPVFFESPPCEGVARKARSPIPDGFEVPLSLDLSAEDYFERELARERSRAQAEAHLHVLSGHAPLGFARPLSSRTEPQVITLGAPPAPEAEGRAVEQMAQASAQSSADVRAELETLKERYAPPRRSPLLTVLALAMLGTGIPTSGSKR